MRFLTNLIYFFLEFVEVSEQIINLGLLLAEAVLVDELFHLEELGLVKEGKLAVYVGRGLG